MMKKRKYRGLLAFIILILAFVGAYLYFDREDVSRYFPADTAFVLRVNDFKPFLTLDSPLIQDKTRPLRQLKFLKYLPSKDFYLVRGRSGHNYIFVKLSFFARFLKRYGQVEKNIFCVTDDEDFILDSLMAPGEVMGMTSQRGDASFVIAADGFLDDVLPEGSAVYGTINVKKQINTLSVDYRAAYEGSSCRTGDARKLEEHIPHRPGLMLKIDIDGIEGRYSELRRLVSGTGMFRSFLNFKKKIFEKTGIDIETETMPLIDMGMIAGVFNDDDYFLFCTSHDAVESMERFEAKLTERYPLRFSYIEKDNITYKTMEITGIAGVLARSIMGEKLDKIKKPFYAVKDGSMFVFDREKNMRFFLAETPFDKNRKQEDMVMENFMRSSHLAIYADARFLGSVMDDEVIKENISAVSANAVLQGDEINGRILFKLKRNYHMEENL